MSENKIATDMHGCIVCARIFSVLAVYAPDGQLHNDRWPPAIRTPQGKLKRLIKDGNPGMTMSQTMNQKPIETVLHGL